MKVYIASDHAGFELKKELIPFLSTNGFEVTDLGPASYVHEDDYPDYVSKVAEVVSKQLLSQGIVIGGSGEGEAMVVNRFKNVRGVTYYGGSKHILTLSREHNDANVLSLGARFMTIQEAKDATLLWLRTGFSNDERHIRRIKKIEKYG